MYNKLTTYSLWCLWLSAVFSILFIITIIGNTNGTLSFFASNEDSSNYDFYNKKLLSRNDKNIKEDKVIVAVVENTASKAAIKNAMLRQSIKLEASVKEVIVKPIEKEKIKAKPKPKSNDGFDVRSIPTQ